MWTFQITAYTWTGHTWTCLNLETTWTYNLAFSVSRFANLEFTSFLLKPLFSGFDILVSGLFTLCFCSFSILLSRGTWQPGQGLVWIRHVRRVADRVHTP